MKSLLSFVLLLALVAACLAAVSVDPDSKDVKGRRLIGKRLRRNAADLRAFHQRQWAAKKHKHYVPYYPAEPIITFIEIGESQQPFIVSLETGVDSAFVLDASYPYILDDESAYDPANSSGLERGFFLGHTGDIGVYGEAYTDIVEFFDPVNQTFGSISGTYGGEVEDPLFIEISGVFGLAWDPSQKDEPVTADSAPILNVFAVTPDLPRHFTQYLSGDWLGEWDFSITAFGGELDGLCNPQPAASAALSYDQAAQSLSFQVDSLSIGGESAPGAAAKVDTGLPTILLPWEAFIIFYDQLTPNYDWGLGVYTTDCVNAFLFDDLVIVVNGVELRVPAYNYVADIELDDGTCVLSFDYTNDFSTPYAFGVPLHLSYCVRHDIDNSQISFLDAVQPQEPTSVAP